MASESLEVHANLERSSTAAFASEPPATTWTFSPRSISSDVIAVTLRAFRLPVAD